MKEHSMRSPTRLCLGLSVLLALGTGTLGLSPAAASPSQPTSAHTLSPGLTTALQRDLGLTASQARTRLTQEAAATNLAPRAERAAGQAFGGSWYDSEHGALVVGLTDTGGAAADSVRSTGATVVRVAHSARTLDATKTALDNVAETDGAPTAVRSWHVDPRTSSVVPRTFAAGTVGGDPYYINGNTRCSIGFSVVGGFVSAGHCGAAGSSVVGWDGSAMGTFAGSSFPGNDYSYIRIGNGAGGPFRSCSAGAGQRCPGPRLGGGARRLVGLPLRFDHALALRHRDPGPERDRQLQPGRGLSADRTNVCAEPGDSGGSFITGDQAQGVTSGGWGNCTSGGQTWFQPVNEILSTYGLT
jgi:streptogrisin C